MLLSKSSLPHGSQVVPANAFSLPEKVIQFGTGVLLRGLIDYCIDEANRQGTFNGRVVVVKSTDKGGADDFQQQDGLFTHVIKGIHNGKTVDHTIINSSISRVLSAREDWQSILACAVDPAIQVIVSNTTEVGISLLDGDSVQATPPLSFPGKLLALLYARFRAGLDGFVIIPTELIVDNGKKLKEIVVTLANQNNLGADFTGWLQEKNEFCSSLVDRIVPGKLPEADRNFDYTDNLAILSEPYSLWAIEANTPKVGEVLSFSRANSSVVIAPDITKYRELKLRLLNGTHTLSCGVAALVGIETVKEGMKDELLQSFIEKTMMNELAPAVTSGSISLEEARAYGSSVLDRFRNPFIQHKWLSITLQYTSKMKMRNVPLILQHYQKNSTPPPLFAFGFAAFILFMKSEKSDGNEFYGSANGIKYLINDDKAGYFHSQWSSNSLKEIGNAILKDVSFWDTDLSSLPGFRQAVDKYMLLISSLGIRPALQSVL